jgi:rare lipoprotein A
MIRRALALGLLASALAACGGRDARDTPSGPVPVRGGGSTAPAPAGPPVNPLEGEGPPPACAVVVDHDERHYTPGGLYAPHLNDAAPEVELDVSGIPEPVPRAEPRSRYGNRSPYTVLGREYRVLPTARGYSERGVASWYGTKFHGRQTSSLERYDMCSFSAAHKSLPLPSYVRVTNLDNGLSVVVRVNDRGPFHAGRIIDLSYAAAVRLQMTQAGTARVHVEAIDVGEAPAGAVAATPAPPPAPRPAAPPRPTDAVPPGSPRHAGTPVPATRAPAPAATAAGPGWLQVGSYAERDNARAVRERLRAAGVRDVVLQDARVDGRRVWRVRIGPLRAGEAPAIAERVVSLGLPRPRLLAD